ncbi:RNA polymerase sigma factor SigJ [Ramlibacter sp.]|uniref:RNA polymerase sigma factor SigJ n=1 Tax=Ramlibacter sp. TaxID=1917967 RepID=UPI0017D92C58|nr:RNA polymerase sigma factor SigJ [Ramlibacter sp.]MBA2673283.1 RNA polymerase sigma factor SigJ [Ramlibacter sp.]
MSTEVDLLLQRERGRLFALAYRMLGSVGEAEDAVQEAFTRWYAQPRDAVQNPAGFLTTVVANICLDQLKSARRRHEDYPGVWLPEPVAALQDGPEDDLQRLESISLAFVSLLEALNPLERAVFVLVEVFDYAHAEVAAMLGRTPEACRQALHRARQSLAAHRRAVAPAERHRKLLLSFVAAVQRGDVDELAQMLADDVESRADGGGFVNAAARPITGVRAVSRLFAGLSKQSPPDLAVRIETVNGWPAALLSSAGVLWSVLQLRADDGARILRIDNVMNPYKLARVAAAFGLRTATDAP